MTEHKPCTRCKRPYSEVDWYKSGNGSWCKHCLREVNRKHQSNKGSMDYDPYVYDPPWPDLQTYATLYLFQFGLCEECNSPISLMADVRYIVLPPKGSNSLYNLHMVCDNCKGIEIGRQDKPNHYVAEAMQRALDAMAKVKRDNDG